MIKKANYKLRLRNKDPDNDFQIDHLIDRNVSIKLIPEILNINTNNLKSINYETERT